MIPSILVENVHKRFRDVHAVNDATFRINPGEVVALLGPNGAGKTTTLDMLLDLQRPDSGRIQMLGESPRQALDTGGIGCVLQQGELLKGVRVAELVRAMSALQPAPLAFDDVVRWAGLADILQRRTERLSGGETQRVRFALALVGDPRMLILDEPTAAMDISARRSFWATIRMYVADGRTVLFSTHYLEEADAIADRIILMANGRIVADGPATAIRAVTATRMLRCTLPAAEPDALRRLPAVFTVEVNGDAVTIRSGDSDTTLRSLLRDYPDACDIEVTMAPLADAVLAFTDRTGATPAGVSR
ncbi:ABC transporter ATP-binding protein [Virgisporangium aurantiacum]|uniref:ABC transporter ATP-binding protein n=1 Tax=Virgisporangium aurantiacum TaxID=175570 RepID=A0A8J4E5T3_9ACTN|nr:ABC transporter ATP-binding protein [Virgisporangium aurantiacum]GIJ62469.1 ABC transporter ATP-binding protein [Virgisporangium aurantiacum]